MHTQPPAHAFATVISVTDAVATVSVDRSVACPRCAAGKGCGAGLLAGVSKPAVLDIAVPGWMSVHEGEQVRLELEPSRILKASVFVYGLPLLGVILALILGGILIGPLSDQTAIWLSIGGFLAGFACGRHWLGRDRCLEQFVPVISSTSLE